MRVLFVALFALYVVTLFWLSAGVPFVFTSPDENANFFFASTFMTTSDFGWPDTINIPLSGIVHPRSVVVVGMLAQPGSFVGWPFFAGVFGKVAGAYGMLALTPFLAALGLCMWWDVGRVLTGDKRVATVAAALLALHPAFWYFAARSMMHNIPFLVALIAAAWVVCVRPFSRASTSASAQALEYGLGGLAIGTALFIRTSEMLWVLSVTAIVAYVWRRRVRHWGAWLALVVGIAVPLCVMGAWNAYLYGSPLMNGYTFEDTGDVTANAPQTATTETPSFSEEIAALLLPFGVHPRAVVKNIWHYGIALFPAFSSLAAAGLLLCLWITVRNSVSYTWRVLAWLTLGLAVWLGVLYGSWSFNDNPDPNAITIGDSHVRYWLPLFALSTLFAARAIATLVASCKRQAWAAGAVVLAVGVLSVPVVFGGPDGLLRTREVLFQSAHKRAALLNATEDSAIIVVDRADKFLFPYRRVIHPLRSERTYAALPDAVNLAPLYYYGIPFPESDMTYLNTVKLAGLGLRIDPVMLVGDEMLYRITEVVE